MTRVARPFPSLSPLLNRRRFLQASGAAVLGAALPACTTLQEDSAVKARHLVGASAATIDRFRTIKDLQTFARNIPDSKAVVILPSLVKAGFIGAGEGGNGVLIARYADGSWGQPAFYTLASASVGLQAGIQETEVILLIRNDGALQAILDNQGKFGADAGLTFAVFGVGLEASTTSNLNADVLAFANSKVGLFGGASLEGSVLVRRQDLNTAIYGAKATPQKIIFDRAQTTAIGDPLRKALAGT